MIVKDGTDKRAQPLHGMKTKHKDQLVEMAKWQADEHDREDSFYSITRCSGKLYTLRELQIKLDLSQHHLKKMRRENHIPSFARYMTGLELERLVGLPGPSYYADIIAEAFCLPSNNMLSKLFGEQRTKSQHASPLYAYLADDAADLSQDGLTTKNALMRRLWMGERELDYELEALGAQPVDEEGRYDADETLLPLGRKLIWNAPLLGMESATFIVTRTEDAHVVKPSEARHLIESLIGGAIPYYELPVVGLRLPRWAIMAGVTWGDPFLSFPVTLMEEIHKTGQTNRYFAELIGRSLFPTSFFEDSLKPTPKQSVVYEDAYGNID